MQLMERPADRVSAFTLMEFMKIPPARLRRRDFCFPRSDVSQVRPPLRRPAPRLHNGVVDLRPPGTGRVEAFSDGVFAIAITLLILEIHVPGDTSHLLDELLQLWPSYLAYVVTFLLIGLVWANHHVMFEYIERSDRLLLFLNTLLLMNVASLPFVAAVLASALRNGEGENVAVGLYGGTLAVGGVFFNALWLHASRHHRLLNDTITPTEARALAQRFLAGPVLYLAGTVVGVFFPIAGIVVFAFLILFYWLPPQRLRRVRET